MKHRIGQVSREKYLTWYLRMSGDFLQLIAKNEDGLEQVVLVVGGEQMTIPQYVAKELGLEREGQTVKIQGRHLDASYDAAGEELEG